jgi:hypothetical protein
MTLLATVPLRAVFCRASHRFENQLAFKHSSGRFP